MIYIRAIVSVSMAVLSKSTSDFRFCIARLRRAISAIMQSRSAPVFEKQSVSGKTFRQNVSDFLITYCILGYPTLCLPNNDYEYATTHQKNF